MAPWWYFRVWKSLLEHYICICLILYTGFDFNNPTRNVIFVFVLLFSLVKVTQKASSISSFTVGEGEMWRFCWGWEFLKIHRIYPCTKISWKESVFSENYGQIGISVLWRDWTFVGSEAYDIIRNNHSLTHYVYELTRHGTR